MKLITFDLESSEFIRLGVVQTKNQSTIGLLRH